MKTVTVFGNEVEERDSLAVRLIPKLQKQFPAIEFVTQDPTENMEPACDPWIILDVGIGIHEITVIEDLHQLEHVKGESVHDYDVYLDLRLKEKLGQLPHLKIILIPSEWPEQKALKEIAKQLELL